MNPKCAHVYQTNWWHLESGWIGFGERPFDDREIGLLWEIGQFEHKTVHLPGNRYRFEPNTAGTLRATVSKGMDGQPWQRSCYVHEATTVEELRAWVEKKLKAEAERRAWRAANAPE
jgi:hypothetical protein